MAPMTYSGSETIDILTLRSGFSSITTEAVCIQRLSAQMRAIKSVQVQLQAIQLWIAHVRQCQPENENRLIAFFYLANDAVQLLRGNEAQLHYRYQFAPYIAEAICIIAERAPVCKPKIARVLSIFRERCTYDSTLLDFFQKMLDDPSAARLVKSFQESFDTVRIQNGIQQLLCEQEQRRTLGGAGTVPQTHMLQSHMSQSHVSQSHIPQQHAKQLHMPVPVPSAQPLVTTVNVPSPSMESLMEAGQVIYKIVEALHYQRPHNAVNSDAEIVSRIRGYRVIFNAPISDKDSELMQLYESLLHMSRQNRASLDEKVKRRQREEEQAQFSLTTKEQSQTLSASNRVLILLKKEWKLRCEKKKINYAIYWHLVRILEHLIQRWNYIHFVSEGIDNEIKLRKNKALSDSMSTSKKPTVSVPTDESKNL